MISLHRSNDASVLDVLGTTCGACLEPDRPLSAAGPTLTEGQVAPSRISTPNTLVSPSAMGMRFSSRQRVCNPARRRDHDNEMAIEMFPIGRGATLRELEEDPHPLLARLRAAEPVSWLPVLGGWVVTRDDPAVRGR